MNKDELLKKLDKTSNIFYWIISGVFVACEIIVGIEYYDSVITFDQFLLYSVCVLMVLHILEEDQKDRKKDNEADKSGE